MIKTEAVFDQVCASFWADYIFHLSQYPEADPIELLGDMAVGYEDEIGIPEHMLRQFVLQVQ